MKVEIWSDVVCPWCYIGKRHFEAALARFAHQDEVEVVWRAFELDPGAPRERAGNYVANLASKYGTSIPGAQQMIDRMTLAGAEDGLDLRFERARPGNTFDAHRLLHLAAARGRQDALAERLFAAAFTDGEPIGDPETLVGLATEVGLDEADARAVLESDTFADDVRAEEAAAADIGVTGVPFFVVDRRYAVSGAQPADLLLSVLERAWQERAPLTVVAPATGNAGSGPGCDGDSCAV